MDLLLWDEPSMSGGNTPYGTEVKYKCQAARKFADPDTGALYDSKTIRCLWTADWSDDQVRLEKTVKLD